MIKRMLCFFVILSSYSCQQAGQEAAGPEPSAKTKYRIVAILDDSVEMQLKQMNASEFCDIIDTISDINAVNGNGRTLLHLCVLKKRLDLMPLLFSRGIDHDHLDDSGFAAIHLAGLWLDFEAIRILLAHGVDVDARSRHGQTCLHLACSAPYKYTDGLPERIVRLLLEAKADPNCRDILGMTPLHFAAYCTLVPVCRMLVAGGANTSIVDYKLRSPADLARHGFEKDEGINILSKYGMHLPDQGRISVEFVLRALLK